MSTSQFKIFLVDDNAFHLNMMKQILLAQNQTDIHLFEDGIDCLNNIHLKPEIVFLDHNMDVYSGFTVLRKIKRFNPDIFVVMVSAQEEIKTAVDSLKYGAFDYIQKTDGFENSIETVFQKIIEVKETMRAEKPTILKTIFQYL
jgi:DNA-binding NtrC family response regulator